MFKPSPLKQAGVFYVKNLYLLEFPNNSLIPFILKLYMKGLSELTRIEKLIENQGDLAQIKVLDTVKAFNKEFPIYGITIGTHDKTKPTFGLFGGVHGLEKIGTQCVTAYLESLFEQLRWDEDLRNRFKNVRLVSIPLVNPAGMYANTRSNPRGVDLMRNSPIEAPDKPLFLVGGHRYSSKLPYFRGHANTEWKLKARPCAILSKNKCLNRNPLLRLMFTRVLELSIDFGIPLLEVESLFRGKKKLNPLGIC